MQPMAQVVIMPSHSCAHSGRFETVGSHEGPKTSSCHTTLGDEYSRSLGIDIDHSRSLARRTSNGVLWTDDTRHNGRVM